jgi:hypothetical protein
MGNTAERGRKLQVGGINQFFYRPGAKLAVKGQKAIGKGLPENKFRMSLISFAFAAFFFSGVFCLGFMGIRKEDQADSCYQNQDEQPGRGSIFHAKPVSLVRRS